jgi:hypothetical protein
VKITEKQLLMLIKVLEGSLNIVTSRDYNPFLFSEKTRVDLYNAILDQQSSKLKEITDD